MRKIRQIERWKNQQTNQIYTKLHKQQKQTSEHLNKQQLIEQYEYFVNITFCANIFHRGIDYASNIYNQIVKMEATRLSNYIIQQALEPIELEEWLYSIHRKKVSLLKHSPIKDKHQGFSLLFGLTGGYRKKYEPTRKTIKQFYLIICTEERKTYLRYWFDQFQVQLNYYRRKRQYYKWLLKNYLWF